MLKILIPKKQGVFSIAAEEFSSLWKKVTGKKLSVILKDDGRSDLVVLGSDAVNSFTHEKIIGKVIRQFEIRTGTDDYQLVGAKEKKRKYLFIAGGRPRALLYGVYHFFEQSAGCGYFWDGDVIPEKADLGTDGVNILEKPRFEYRGLRYFAHRSLNRFQAEHWDFDEWKHEIDWMLKKRLNMFMLRIGIDDLFQRAFPDVVKYPGAELPESTPRSYDDRNLFWPLKYRGELRKKILEYARERDIIHPEDIGTMTHWYSRTPYDFLRHFKPSFIPQTTEGYNQDTGLVWDIRDDRNLDLYYKLTQTHIREYGSPEMFHTIGLAERMCYEDHASNHQMKLYTYRRIISRLRADYPHAPLLIGSWDFCMYWTPEEIKSLLRELDPENTMIFDYTSDTTDEVNNFMNWGVVGRFPWMFGIFHAYEPATEFRGNYDQIERRLPVAADDPMCKGLVYWPECSHTDTLMLDFMPFIAWNPDRCAIGEYLPRFCEKRYPGRKAEMLKIWRMMMPLIRKIAWNGPQDKLRLPGTFCDLVFKLLDYPYTSTMDAENLSAYRRLRDHLKKEIRSVPDAFRMLEKLSSRIDGDFMRRDVVDLARTAVSRLQSYAFSLLMLSMENWRNSECGPDSVLKMLGLIRQTVELESGLLDSHEDFSLNDALTLLNRKHKVYSGFEKTLKGNAENFYCRTFASELFSGIYLPEFGVFENWISSKIKAGDRSRWERPAKLFEAEQKKIRDEFYASPLRKYAPDRGKAARELPQTLRKLAAAAEIITEQEESKCQN